MKARMRKAVAAVLMAATVAIATGIDDAGAMMCLRCYDDKPPPCEDCTPILY